MNFENNVPSYYEAQASGESLGRYTAKTFGWMFAGLMVTFIVAVAGLMTGAIVYVYSIPYWYYLLLIAEVGTVIFLSARIEKLSVGAARALFFLYAASLIFPLLWLFINSLQDRTIYEVNLALGNAFEFPSALHWENYSYAFTVILQYKGAHSGN